LWPLPPNDHPNYRVTSWRHAVSVLSLAVCCAKIFVLFNISGIIYILMHHIWERLDLVATPPL